MEKSGWEEICSRKISFGADNWRDWWKELRNRRQLLFPKNFSRNAILRFHRVLQKPHPVAKRPLKSEEAWEAHLSDLSSHLSFFQEVFQVLQVFPVVFYLWHHWQVTRLYRCGTWVWLWIPVRCLNGLMLRLRHNLKSISLGGKELPTVTQNIIRRRYFKSWKWLFLFGSADRYISIFVFPYLSLSPMWTRQSECTCLCS